MVDWNRWLCQRTCNKNCAACCMVVSVWGIIMLTIIGILYAAAPANKERILVDPESHVKPNARGGVATACFIAAGMYAVTLVICVWQRSLPDKPVVKSMQEIKKEMEEEAQRRREEQRLRALAAEGNDDDGYFYAAPGGSQQSSSKLD